MQLFLDGSDIDKIRKYSDFGVIDGVTTNPSIILKSGKNMIEGRLVTLYQKKV